MSFQQRLVITTVALVLCALIGIGPAAASAADCDGDGVATVEPFGSVEGAVACGGEMLGAALEARIKLIALAGIPAVAGVGIWIYAKRLIRQLTDPRF